MAVDNPVIIGNNRIYVVEEATAGVYDPPSAAAEAVLPLEDALDFGFNIETVERTVLTPNIGQAKPRAGIKTSTGTLGFEFKANGIEGTAPQISPFVKGALGSEALRVADATTVEALAAATSLTLGTHAFQVDDIILIKIAGNFHVTPITAITSTEITILRPLPATAAIGTVIAAVAIYKSANTGFPSLSITREIPPVNAGAGISERIFGQRINSMSLGSFVPGQIPTLTFGLQGLGFSFENSILSLGTAFDAGLPPICLSACVFRGATLFDVNEIGFEVSNTVGDITSTCDPNGILANLITDRSISGTFTDYLQSDDIGDFTRFENNESFSLFAFAGIPTSTSGEFEDVVAFYLPQCTITEVTAGDQDGVITNVISYEATGGDNGDELDISIAFI